MIRTFFNQKADSWDKEVAEKDTEKLEAMADRLCIMPEDKILDVGTGTGVFVPYLMNKIGPEGGLVAIDIAERMLEKLWGKMFQGNVTYIQADIAFAPLCSEYFNVVVCYSAFPHFQNKIKSLSEIYRVLKNNGFLYICHTSGRNIINSIHSEIPLIKNDLVPESNIMMGMLSEAGFREIIIDEGTDSYFVSARKL